MHYTQFECPIKRNRDVSLTLPTKSSKVIQPKCLFSHIIQM